MANKTFNTRVKNKRDTAANWEAVATTFQPLDGELIIVDTSAGKTRFKVGRYDTAKGRLLYYNEIPFADEYLYNDLNESQGKIYDTIKGIDDKSIIESTLEPYAGADDQVYSYHIGLWQFPKTGFYKINLPKKGAKGRLIQMYARITKDDGTLPEDDWAANNLTRMSFIGGDSDIDAIYAYADYTDNSISTNYKVQFLNCWSFAGFVNANIYDKAESKWSYVGAVRTDLYGLEITKGDTTINYNGKQNQTVSIPTKTSELTNDSDFTTQTDLDNLTNTVVSYNAQENITDEQKAQARTNIGAISSDDLVQSDWNQNDVEAKDYVKNRPGAYYTTIEDASVSWSNLTSSNLHDMSESLRSGSDTAYICGDNATIVNNFSISENDAVNVQYTDATGSHEFIASIKSVGDSLYTQVNGQTFDVGTNDILLKFSSNVPIIIMGSVTNSKVSGFIAHNTNITAVSIKKLNVVKIPEYFLDLPENESFDLTKDNTAFNTGSINYGYKSATGKVTNDVLSFGFLNDSNSFPILKISADELDTTNVDYATYNCNSIEWERKNNDAPSTYHKVSISHDTSVNRGIELKETLSDSVKGDVLVKGVKTPIDDNYAANKKYVDDNKSLMCTITGAGTDASPYVCDKTYDEIVTAINNGQIPYCIESGAAVYGDKTVAYYYKAIVETPVSKYVSFTTKYQIIGDTSIEITSANKVNFVTQNASVVTSINNKQGMVTLKTSDLENDSNYISTVDDTLSTDSTNPVQNKVVKAAIDDLQASIDEQEPLIGTTDTLTTAQVQTAVLAGRPVVVSYTDTTYGELKFTNFAYSTTQDVIASNMIAYYADTGYILAELVGTKTTWSLMTTVIAEKADLDAIDTALSNKLQYKGTWQTNTSYNKNDVVYDGTNLMYVYTDSDDTAGGGDPPDINPNCQPLVNIAYDLNSGTNGVPNVQTIRNNFSYLLNASTTDSGKSLTVNTNGKPEWKTLTAADVGAITNETLQTGLNYVTDNVAQTCIKYSEEQTLTDTQKTQARNNIGAASASTIETMQEAIDSKPSAADAVYTATAASTDGVAYTATVSGIDSLTVGASFIMIPNKASTSKAPTLNVNGLGAQPIRRRLSSLTTSLQQGYSTNWIALNKPFTVVYDGTAWVIEGLTKTDGADVYGAVAQATADANGNNIADTYATIAMLQSLLPKVTTITLTSNWVGDASPYYQDIALSCVTETSIVDLQPTPEQLNSWQDDGLAFTTLSGNGTVRMYVAGGKPSSAISVQVRVQEVTVI